MYVINLFTLTNYYGFLKFLMKMILDDHCHLFPRALGEILDRYQVSELHISLTSGLWRHDVWGYPVVDAPPGAELYVWFRNNTEK